MNYQIYVDASADIAKEVVEKYDIKFIPMEYSLGDEIITSYGLEKKEVLNKFYDGLRNGLISKTTQITPYLYEKLLKETLSTGTSILYLPLSSGLSATYTSAKLAADSLNEKYPEAKLVVCDSLSATCGIGLLAELAARNRENGLSIEENKESLEKARTKLKHWFMVDDLMHLKRGGRINAASAIVGSVLSIKPILSINKEGKLDIIAKKHGKKLSLTYIVEKVKETFDPTLSNVIYIGDAGTIEGKEELRQKINDAFPEAEIRDFVVSPVIGAHVGPGMLCACSFGKEEN